MSEPRRLKDEGGPAADLLRSASDDAPPPSTRHALALALGIPTAAPLLPPTAAATPAAAAPTAAAPTAAAAVGGAKVAVPLVVKAVAAIGLLVGGGAVVVKATSTSTTAPMASPMPRPTPTPPPPPRAVEAVAPAPVVAPVAPAPAPREPAPSAIKPAATSAPHSPSRAVTPPPAEPTAAADDAPSAPPRSTLADEVALIDAAVAAVRRHDPAAALATLDRYAQQFPGGVMAQEASVARIQAMVAAGDVEGAHRLGNQFLAAHAGSPLAQRVRALIGAPAASP